MTNPREKLRLACLSAAKEIRSECAAVLEQPQRQNNNLAGCGEALVQLLYRQASQLLSLSSQRDETSCRRDANDADAAEAERKSRLLLLRRLEDILSTSYSRFYAYLFKDLPLCWRQLYTDAAILKFAALYLLLFSPDRNNLVSPYSSEDEQQPLDEMIKTLDLALILAGAAGDKRGRRWIDSAFSLLQEVVTLSSSSQSKSQNCWDATPSFSAYEPFTPPIRHPVPRAAEPPSLEAFQSYLTASPPPLGTGPSPLVISSALTAAWPARTTRPWAKPAYLLSRTFSGRRLVPVEVGRSYVDPDWTQKFVSFSDFLQQPLLLGQVDASSSSSGPSS